MPIPRFSSGRMASICGSFRSSSLRESIALRKTCSRSDHHGDETTALVNANSVPGQMRHQYQTGATDTTKTARPPRSPAR